MTDTHAPQHPGAGTPTSVQLAQSDDPDVLAVIFYLPSGRTMSAVGHATGFMLPHEILPAAKSIVTSVVDRLQKEGDRDSDLERTNIVSLVAAVQALVKKFDTEYRLRHGSLQ